MENKRNELKITRMPCNWVTTETLVKQYKRINWLNRLPNGIIVNRNTIDKLFKMGYSWEEVYGNEKD